MCTPTLFVWLISFSLLQAFWMENVVECTAIEILLLLLGFGKLIFKEQPELREEIERMCKE